jgi:murE/murF fusion protein
MGGARNDEAGQDGTRAAKLILDELKEQGVAISNLVCDSRKVTPGDVFVAYPGERQDGRGYIGQAIASGAAAVLWERTGFEWREDWRVANSGVMGLKALAGTIAHIACGRPSEQMWVVGVTGTNGKTSCSQWLAAALGTLGRKSAVIGTLGSGFPGAFDKSIPNTTPEAITLHRELARFLREGAKAVIMEASSIGLAQGRLNSVAFDVALFTNLTRDHLDYHGSMEAYGAAKAMLFDWPGLRHAVINLDDPFGTTLADRLGGRVRRTGFCLERADEAALAEEVDQLIVARGIRVDADGIEFDIEGPAHVGRAHVKSPVLGRFNVSNLLGVAATLLASGYSLSQAASALGVLEPVPGRLERIGGGGEPLVVIDYAHSPDALAQALAALRDVANAGGGRLFCVFGCGGDRDRGKRPLMGEIAARLADRVFLTSDNPRTEDPSVIIADIVHGMPPGGACPPVIEPDRRKAIVAAMAAATPRDVLLLAGKGHETWQEIGGRRIPFSDIAVAGEALRGPAAPAKAMLTVREAAREIGARDLGSDQSFQRVCSDSRAVRQGDLFVALRGERFDGHAFVKSAAAQGAAAAMVDERGERERDFTGVARIVVDDTVSGLGRLAGAWRARFELPLLAVLGSNGKTTVKELLAAIMRREYGAREVLATPGNLNNEIGLPLTLLALLDLHRCAVIEMGMNHPGEIARLAAIARPTLAVINNAQREHQEFLHSVEDAARANGEVFAAMAADGTAVLNADDACIGIWREQNAGRRVVTFGLEAEADVRGRCTLTGFGADLEIATPSGTAKTKLQLAGVHNARNALAAAAAAFAAGATLESIAEGLASVAPVQGRLQKRSSAAGAAVIDDTYNANPDSVRAAIALLAGFSAPTVLVLGDMGEVGKQGVEFHREIGAYAHDAGIGRLIGLGDLARHAAEAFGPAGTHAGSLDELLSTLRQSDRPGATILVKGSRFMRMERVVAALSGEAAGEGH